MLVAWRYRQRARSFIQSFDPRAWMMFYGCFLVSTLGFWDVRYLLFFGVIALFVLLTSGVTWMEIRRAFLFIVGVLMGQWYLNRFVFHKGHRTFGASILVAFGFSAFLIYFMPWLIGRFPQTLWLSDDGVCRVQGNAAKLLKYGDIASFEWRVNDDFATLSFDLTKGKGMALVGVPLDISREAVSQFLVERGILEKQ